MAQRWWLATSRLLCTRSVAPEEMSTSLFQEFSFKNAKIVLSGLKVMCPCLTQPLEDRKMKHSDMSHIPTSGLKVEGDSPKGDGDDVTGEEERDMGRHSKQILTAGNKVNPKGTHIPAHTYTPAHTHTCTRQQQR